MTDTSLKLAALAALAAGAYLVWRARHRTPDGVARMAAEQLRLKGSLADGDRARVADIVAGLPDRPWRAAGVDISFVPGNATAAVATLVVVELPSLERVAGLAEVVALSGPYVPGYLAFREVAHYVRLLERLRRERPDCVPDVVIVDGNGALHPRGFGLAAHLGVLADVPTIGAAKSLARVDGLDEKAQRARCAGLRRGQFLPLVGESGRVWGAALRSSAAADGGASRPIFVSAGHGVSLDSAVALVRACCRVRVPEPVRLADLEGRARVREGVGTKAVCNYAKGEAEAGAAGVDGPGFAGRSVWCFQPEHFAFPGQSL